MLWRARWAIMKPQQFLGVNGRVMRQIAKQRDEERADLKARNDMADAGLTVWGCCMNIGAAA